MRKRHCAALPVLRASSPQSSPRVAGGLLAGSRVQTFRIKKNGGENLLARLFGILPTFLYQRSLSRWRGMGAMRGCACRQGLGFKRLLLSDERGGCRLVVNPLTPTCLLALVARNSIWCASFSDARDFEQDARDIPRKRIWCASFSADGVVQRNANSHAWGRTGRASGESLGGTLSPPGLRNHHHNLQQRHRMPRRQQACGRPGVVDMHQRVRVPEPTHPPHYKRRICRTRRMRW